MCFICGALCVAVPTECGFAFEFCEACLCENEHSLLEAIMEGRHATECGCRDGDEFALAPSCDAVAAGKRFEPVASLPN